MTTNEPTTGMTETAPQGTAPPEAVDRIKRERDQFKAERDQFATVAQQALLVDKVHQHLRSQESHGFKDPYEAAKRATASLPADVTDETLGQSVDAWLAEMSNLFAPVTPAQQQTPMSPMAAGGNPVVGGEPPSSGPFMVNSKEFKEYQKQHGTEAAMDQIRSGMFVFSDANEAAQATARSR